MDMKGTVVSFETAELLKETPLNSWKHATCAYTNINLTYAYRSGGEVRHRSLEMGLTYNPDVVPNGNKLYAPIQSTVHTWLREQHQVYVNVFLTKGIGKWSAHVKPMIGQVVNHHPRYGLHSYEEAMEKGLQDALKLIKPNKGS